MFVRYSCVLLMLLLGCTPQSGEQQSKNTGDDLGGTTAQKERVEEEEIGEPEPDELLPVAPLPVVEVVSDPWVPTVPFFGGGGGGNSKLNCSKGLAEGDACSDGDICTYSDRCVAGKCVGNDIPECCTEKTVATACDDNDPCTDQVCNEFNECEYPPAQGPIPCDDNNLCTTNDTCSNGACAGTPNVVCSPNACNTSACNPATGMCDLTPKTDGTDCSPLFPSSCVESYECDCGECVANNFSNGMDCSTSCDRKQFCAEGICIAQQPDPVPVCPDSDTTACTTSLCLESMGEFSCGYSITDTCVSGDPCFTAQDCNPATGACDLPGIPVVCDDGDPCTTDTCEGGLGGAGCVYTPIGGPTCLGCTTAADCLPNPALPTCSDWSATCVAGLCEYSVTNNLCPQPINKCQSSRCTKTGCSTVTKVCVVNGYSCKSARCDPADGICKPVTKTSICPFPQKVCCDSEIDGTGTGVCVPNCFGPFCGCLFAPEIPQP